MPKNKGQFGKGRPAEAAEPDEFLTGMDRLVRTLRPHAVRILIAVGAGAAVLIGYAVYTWYANQQSAEASALYSEAVRLSGLPVTEEPVEPPEGVEPDRVMSFESRDERAKAALEKVKELRAGYDGTDVAAQSRLLQADLYMELERYEEAAKLYRNYAQSEAPAYLRLVAREGLGYALESRALAAEEAEARQAGLEKALKAFEAMQPNSEGPRRDAALYHQARVLAALGRRDEALETFQEVLEMPNTQLKQDVELRVAALQASSE